MPITVIIGTSTRSPFWYYRELESAQVRGWLLTTSEIQKLIGVKPRGTIYQRGVFAFSRSGKIGSQAFIIVGRYN